MNELVNFVKYSQLSVWDTLLGCKNQHGHIDSKNTIGLSVGLCVFTSILFATIIIFIYSGYYIGSLQTSHFSTVLCYLPLMLVLPSWNVLVGSCAQYV